MRSSRATVLMSHTARASRVTGVMGFHRLTMAQLVACQHASLTMSWRFNIPMLVHMLWNLVIRKINGSRLTLIYMDERSGRRVC